MTQVLHIALAADWAQALTLGRYEISTRGRTLAQEGFIHTSTPTQARRVFTDFYADLPPEHLRLLVVDLQACAAAGTPTRWEEVPGTGQEFPHLYGPLPVAAVTAVLPFTGPSLPDLRAALGAPGTPR